MDVGRERVCLVLRRGTRVFSTWAGRTEQVGEFSSLYEPITHQLLTNSPTYLQSAAAAAAALHSPTKPAAEPATAATARAAPLRRAGERGGLKFGFQKVRHLVRSWYIHSSPNLPQRTDLPHLTIT
jgi:hypothetical protein